MNDEALNMSIRKFLKTVGVHSQREIEGAVQAGIDAGKLKGSERLPVTVTLTLGGTELSVTFEDTINLE